jgi:hypothetical protein
MGLKERSGGILAQRPAAQHIEAEMAPLAGERDDARLVDRGEGGDVIFGGPARQIGHR